MTHTRHIGALLALVLTLVLAACSTPADLNAPTLEPQFGTADDDIGIDVASVSTGRIYSLSKQSGDTYYYDGDTSYYNETYTKILLKRQDSSGNVVWSREVGSAACNYDTYQQGDPCTEIEALSLVADAQGNVNVLAWEHYFDGDQVDYIATKLSKYDASGNYISERYLPDSISWATEFTVDGSGNTYVASTNIHREYNDYGNYTETYTNAVAKYSVGGTLLWQRTSTVGTPSDITVSSSGSVYVVGTAGIARYTSSGNLSWTKPGNFYDVVVSGSNIYTRYNTTIYKYDGTGARLWAKTQSGLNTLVLQAIDGDGSGNVYLSGKYRASNGIMDAMTRKLSASGSIVWTKTYGTPAYDDARGIATITGSEIYITGETQGGLAHTNIGGRDGYVRKLNSSGAPQWMK